MEQGTNEKKDKSEEVLQQGDGMEGYLVERSEHPPPHVPVQRRALTDGLPSAKSISKSSKKHHYNVIFELGGINHLAPAFLLSGVRDKARGDWVVTKGRAGRSLVGTF